MNWGGLHSDIDEHATLVAALAANIERPLAQLLAADAAYSLDDAALPLGLVELAEVGLAINPFDRHVSELFLVHLSFEMFAPFWGTATAPSWPSLDGQRTSVPQLPESGFQLL